MVNHGDPSISHPVWESIHARQYISLASVVCLLWEHLLTISHEYTYVWKSRLTVTKWLYLLLRYISIVCQLANHFVSAKLLSNPPLTQSTCVSWFTFQALYLQVVEILFESILLVRVWALYHKARRVGLFLSSMFLCEVVLVLSSILRAKSHLQFDETCLLMETPREAYFFALTPLVTQVVIWTMTWYKQINGLQDSSWYGIGTPITTLMFRDGLIAFILMTSIFSVCLSYSLYVHDLTDSVWTILVSLLSIGGCRIIMNMQRLKIPRVPSEVELTSYIETSCVSTGVNLLPGNEEEEEDGTLAEFPI